jgi:hypothetical protein
MVFCTGHHFLFKATISTMPVVTMDQVSLPQQYSWKIPRFSAQ